MQHPPHALPHAVLRSHLEVIFRSLKVPGEWLSVPPTWPPSQTGGYERAAPPQALKSLPSRLSEFHLWKKNRCGPSPQKRRERWSPWQHRNPWHLAGKPAPGSAGASGGSLLPRCLLPQVLVLQFPDLNHQAARVSAYVLEEGQLEADL